MWGYEAGEQTERKITYVEAVRGTKEQQKEHKEAGVQENRQNTDDRVQHVDKRALVTFIVGIINSTAEEKWSNSTDY